CAMFAATSGSSVATAATIGTVALGEVEKRGYSERLFLGTIAAGGTLGILIPPSINMIVYGVLTETSIPKLYLAGFIPGVILASLFSLTVLIICLIKPQYGGKPTSATWAERITALPDLLPPLIIFLAVIGSIYAGWATATESAALAVVIFYFILGMFMETLSMMVATVPIIAPIMFKAGYDPVWFGIIIIILMELAMITPPVGINLYVVQGLRKRGKIDDVIIGASP